jgi:hypothetical protein
MTGLPRPILAASAAAAVLLAACTGATEPGAEPDDVPGEATPGDGPRDLTELTRDDLRTVLSPDSIPSIDDPKFISPDEASEWLEAKEPVAVLVIEDDARAYPLQIMTWHEIVNDEVGGEPVAVTYCPLCNSALAYPRTVEGQVLDFGTSGSLYNSALVMYDRQTESLWLHFEGLAFEGPLEGTRLEFIPVQILSFEQFREEHPQGLVLSRDTGHNRDYGQNPYALYDTSNRPFLFDGEIDPRLEAIARVVGVEVGGEPVAFPYEILTAPGGAAIVHDTVGGDDIVVFWKAGVRSALDEPRIEEGRDVGSSGVFIPEVDGRTLTFRAEGDRILDEETGSTWSLAGRATSGPLAGAELERIAHLDTFWFAWSSHKPDTRIVEG